METIRPATKEDRYLLVGAYFAMLQWLDSQNYPFLPTLENAQIMVDEFFMPAIEDDRSGIVIVEIDGRPVGVLFWVIEAMILKTRFPIATSYGQWVHEEHRGKQLVGRMIFHVAANFRRLGVGQVLDMVHVPEAVGAAEKAGFRTNPKVVILELNS